MARRGNSIDGISSSLTPDLEPLLDAFANRVAAKLEQRFLSCRAATAQRLLSIEAAAKYIGRSKDAVEHMVSNGKLPTVRGDRRIFIDVRDLDVWIDTNKRPAV